MVEMHAIVIDQVKRAKLENSGYILHKCYFVQGNVFIFFSCLFSSYACRTFNSFCQKPSSCRYQIPDDWPYRDCRRLFKEPSILTDSDQLDLKWTAPDEEVSDWQKSVDWFDNFPLTIMMNDLFYVFLL